MKYRHAFVRFFYVHIVKKIFFLQDPERVHDRMVRMSVYIGKNQLLRKLSAYFFCYTNPMLGQQIKGIYFSNPVGLAAGFDKDGYVYPVLESVGFGFSEIGTITHSAYEGNPTPRLYRLPRSRAIVVNYGLKNEGATRIIDRIKTYRKTIPCIVSIGKTNCSSAVDETAGITDYVRGLEVCKGVAHIDAYEINISCPNTFGGEPFTTSEKLEKLLQAIVKSRSDKPLILKMPINITWDMHRELLDVARKYKVWGVNIGNLNKDRSDPTIQEKIPEDIRGSVSGKPTWERSNELISRTYAYCGSEMVIIGTGGIFCAEDAYEKIKRGASLVQMITGMIYEGPQVVGEINYGLVQLLKADGYTSVRDAIGAYHRY